MLASLALFLLPILQAPAKPNSALTALELGRKATPFGAAVGSVNRMMAPLAYSTETAPILWAAADYSGPSAFLADSLARSMLAEAFLDPRLVVDERFAIPSGSPIFRGVDWIDLYFLAPGAGQAPRLFAIDATLVGAVGSMDDSFMSTMRSLTDSLLVSPTDLRTSFDPFGSRTLEAVDMAVWKKAESTIFLIMAADESDATVGDEQVMAIDRRMWREYLRAASRDRKRCLPAGRRLRARHSRSEGYDL